MSGMHSFTQDEEKGILTDPTLFPRHSPGRFMEGEHRGYVALTFTREDATAYHYFVDTVAERDYGIDQISPLAETKINKNDGFYGRTWPVRSRRPGSRLARILDFRNVQNSVEFPIRIVDNMELETDSDSMDSVNEANPEQLYSVLQGAALTQALVAAAKLGIAEVLEEGALEAHRLADAVGADQASLERLLRVLASMNVVSQVCPEKFELRPLGRYLLKHGTNSLRDFVLLLGEPWFWESLGRLPDCVRHGKPASELSHGLGFFEFLNGMPRECSRYNKALKALNENAFLECLIQLYDFSNARLIVDVGGGAGKTLAVILNAYPNSRGILFEQPKLRREALATLEGEGVRPRCDFVEGNFRVGVPRGGDVYLLKWILADWNDKAVTEILRACRAAMTHTSRLVVVTGLRHEDEPVLARVSDLMLMVFPGGQRRSQKELLDLIESCGFNLLRELPIMRHHLLECSIKRT